jgi:hypothetical protein
MGAGSFPGVESGRGVTLNPHTLLVPRSKNRVELYLYSPEGHSWPVKRVKPTYNIHNIATMDCTLSQLNSLQVLKSNFFKIYSHIIHPPKSNLPKYYLSLKFSS